MPPTKGSPILEDDSAFRYQKKKSVGSVFAEMMFSHVGLFIVVAVYTCLGAYWFVEIESGAEMERFEIKKMKADNIDKTIAYTAGLLWYYGDEQKFNWTYEDYAKKVNKDLVRVEAFILEAVQNSNYDGTYDGWTQDWTFMNSLLLSMTILTTIGYGNISPVTSTGQMFCIMYALVGCPLFLVFLANLGDSMATGFTYLYSRCCCRCCRSQRYLSELPDSVSKRFAKHIIDDEVGNEEYMPTSQVFVPIVINILLLHLYFLMGGLLFASWENWPTTTSIYFTFVTLSTIGYGDYVPGNSLADDPDSMITTFKLLICVLYIIMGMALLSMCVNLMQEQLVVKCRWVGQKLGLTEKDAVSQPKPIDKRKDSLLPLMEGKTGPSPFRHIDNPYGDDRAANFDEHMLPGIMEE